MSETCVLSTLVLSCESESSSSSDPHHLSWRSHTPSSVFIHSLHHKLSCPSSLFPFFHYAIYPCVYVLFLLPFSIRSPSLYLLSFMFFHFRKVYSSSPYLVIFLLPLEVNLHTYLTIWLSSCPVGIFPRFHAIIAKINHKQSVTIKWTNLKSTHITMTLFPCPIRQQQHGTYNGHQP